MPRIKFTTEQFIEKAIKIHGDKYDYSLSEYVGIFIKVKILCKKHNIVFEQTPKEHLIGNGCKKCAIEYTSDLQRCSYDNFVEKSIKIHSDKYDYTLVEYINAHTKVKIICKECGTHFEQTPKDHITKKCGCPNCVKNKKLTTETFIIKAIKKHGDKYDYSLVVYKDSQTKIKIICKKHNIIFEQRPAKHLYGEGCPICKESKGEIKISKYLKSKNIEYIQQHTFNDCKNILPLPFDFYLPKNNTCIEFDGVQHFSDICWGGKDGLLERQKRDNIKNDYCKNNNISLIRIRYDQKNIDELLCQTLELKN